jgi:plasmid stability protein
MVPKWNPGRKVGMPSLTIKNIPETLYERLKQRAQLNRRSINGEVIACLERDLMPRRISETELRERMRVHRDELAARGVYAPEPEELKRWIEEGRE